MNQTETTTGSAYNFAWVYPALWGMLMYTVLRAITDLARNGRFWEGTIKSHIVALVITVSSCYVWSFVWRRRLRVWDGSKAAAQEYVHVFVELLLSLNIILFVGQHTGVLLMGEGWIDYVLINASYIPLLLIFFTLIRNSIITRIINDRALLLEKMRAEKNEAELHFLKSQYHPHFLFNALNTIYFQVDDKNDDARRSLEKLSDLLRYQLYEVDEKVKIHREIKYLQSYITFQRLRKNENLVVTLDIDAALGTQMIPPLLFQPLVENAFKYVGGANKISFTMKLREKQLSCIVTNSLPASGSSALLGDSGIGLDNLERRLKLLYPGKHQLITGVNNNLYNAELIIHLD